MSDDAGSRPDRPPAAWYPDPFGRHERRWWDGRQWSQRVSDRETPGIDPPGIDPSPQASDLDHPAEPITDVTLPIFRQKVGVTIGLLLAALMIIALFVLIGVEISR